MDTTSSPNRPFRLSGFLTAGLGVVVGLWLTGIAAETATAQTAPDYKSAEVVSYSDLDISKADGARTLLHRIKTAAKQVCGPEPSHSPLLPQATALYRVCLTDAVGSAVATIDAPLVTAMHGDEATAGASYASR
jgi:UrcA family protein